MKLNISESGGHNYSVASIHFLMKVKFQLQVSENKVVIFSSSKLTNPREIYPRMVACAIQVKKGCLTSFRPHLSLSPTDSEKCADLAGIMLPNR